MTRRCVRGSASIEFVFLVPFVLLLLAAIWDIRAFVAARTELARTPYAVAEAIADEPDGASPMANALGLLKDRLEARRRSSGRISAAVVVRGEQRRDGTACPDEAWCPPRVTAVWPTGPATDGSWVPSGTTEPNRCAGPATLPTVGDHFAVNARVLPNEGADPDGDGPGVAAPESEWVSRTMTAAEWWVVIDVCFDPGPGQFLMTLPRLAADGLDLPFTIRRRAVWRSVHDLGDCAWCGPVAP